MSLQSNAWLFRLRSQGTCLKPHFSSSLWIPFLLYKYFDMEERITYSIIDLITLFQVNIITLITLLSWIFWIYPSRMDFAESRQRLLSTILARLYMSAFLILSIITIGKAMRLFVLEIHHMSCNICN